MQNIIGNVGKKDSYLWVFKNSYYLILVMLNFDKIM